MTHRRIAAALSVLIATTVFGQTQPLVQFEVPLDVDSGPVDNATKERGVVYSTAVQIPDAAWVRLAFDDTTHLGAAPAGGTPTVIRVTSVLDGASQSLNTRHLKEWSYTSAYFNGGVLLVEIVADPGAGESRVVMSRATIGPATPLGAQTICGPVDDRLPSDDARTGRLMPVGCTAWLINDVNHCFLTAGHCTGGGSTVMEFNVPLSDSNGSPNHPGPEDQYAVDQGSMQSNGGQGTGDDWAYFGCAANTETGLTAAQAQGAFFVLTDTPPPVSGQNIRITGYGTTSTGVPREWNLAQKTHTGPYAQFAGTRVSYTTDTTGGNSGSPVIDEETGFAIGIHTHGGCDPGGGFNNGTGSNHPELRDAIANPCGVCAIPANDLCSNPAPVGDGAFPFNTDGARTDGGTTSCGVIAKDVWFEYTAPCTGNATSSTCDADFNTRIAMYAVDDCGGAPIACNDDFCGEASSMTFAVVAGERYLVRVGGRSAVGVGTLTIECAKGEACPEDLDGSGAVDFGDILALLAAWGNAGGPEDLDGSGTVDFGDVIVVLGAWGACP